MLFTPEGGSAQAAPADTPPPSGAARDTDPAPLRGRVFEIGPVLGGAAFSNKAGLEACRWAGLRIGHRFDRFSGVERLQLGFRAGWEGCFTDHEEIGRVDVIHLALTWILGARLSPSWQVYWGAGVGEGDADSAAGARLLDEQSVESGVVFG